MAYAPISSCSLPYKWQYDCKLPPIQTLFDSTISKIDTARSTGLYNLIEKWAKKFSDTRSWLDIDARGNGSPELQEHIDFLLEDLDNVSSTGSWHDLHTDALCHLLFQRRINSVSYKVRVNSGPVKTRTPGSKVHAKKERRRRTHQRGTLQVTDLTTGDFVQEVSNRYIKSVKEAQEADLEEEARAEGEVYVCRNRLSSGHRRTLTRAPNKDEVHVRVLFTGILAGLILKRQQDPDVRDSEIRKSDRYRELEEQYEASQAEIYDLKRRLHRYNHQQHDRTLPAIKLDMPDTRQNSGVSYALTSVQSSDATASHIHRQRWPETDVPMTDIRSHTYGLPSPVPSIHEVIHQSSFCSEP